jgi:hypothetical protein
MTDFPPLFPFQLAWILRTRLIFYVPFAQTLGRFCSFHQILENDKILLVLLNRDKVSIYLDRLAEMDLLIQRERPNKCLNREKLGEGALFAFDETMRALVVCAPTKVYPRQCSRPKRANLMYHSRSVTTLFLHL